MKRKNKDRSHKTGFPALALFMCGFFMGNLLPNILWKVQWQQKTMVSLYLLESFAKKEVAGKKYLMETVRIRGGSYILLAFCGCTAFGVPVSVMGTLCFGGMLGVLFSMSVLTFGLAGGLAGAALLFPQYLVYVPLFLFLMSWVYGVSLEIWKRRGLFPDKMLPYAGKVFLGAMICIGGILLEGYLNPWVTEKIFSFLDLF